MSPDRHWLLKLKRKAGLIRGLALLVAVMAVILFVQHQLIREILALVVSGAGLWLAWWLKRLLREMK
ncbi:hypothetical protein [Secundilactobacillus muriivasis]